MKFDDKFKQIIAEWNNYDFSNDELINTSKDIDNDFKYEWSDLQLDDTNDDLSFTVCMTANWELDKGVPGTLTEPPVPDTYKFLNGNEIIYVDVYGIDNDGKEIGESLTEDEFKTKYPKAYDTFMKEYFDTDPDKHPEEMFY